MASIFRRKNGKKWQIGYLDENGAHRTVTGVASKTVTTEIASKLEADVQLRKRGVIDARVEGYAAAERVPLAVKDAKGEIVGGHLADYHAALQAKGDTRKHADGVRTHVAAIIDGGDLQRVSDLTPASVQRVIGDLRHGDEDTPGLSLQTCNHYLRHVKSFSRWLWHNRRAVDDALASMRGANVRTDRRYARRALSIEELRQLIKAAEGGPDVLGMSGADRAVAYRLAVATGFRAAELRSLTPESFDLDADPPTVTVEAGYSKRRRRDEQVISRDVADTLRPWLASKCPDRPVVDLPEKTARMLRVDMQAAEIPYGAAGGAVVDFHSLRHTAGQLRSNAGIHPKALQQFMRHSTITLTMDTYVRPAVTDAKAAAAALPSMDTREPDAKAATA